MPAGRLGTQALPAPDGRGFYVVDLGLDRIVRYPDGLVVPTAPAGAGPRHLLLPPDGPLGEMKRGSSAK